MAFGLVPFTTLIVYHSFDRTAAMADSLFQTESRIFGLIAEWHGVMCGMSYLLGDSKISKSRFGVKLPEDSVYI